MRLWCHFNSDDFTLSSILICAGNMQGSIPKRKIREDHLSTALSMQVPEKQQSCANGRKQDQQSMQGRICLFKLHFSFLYCVEYLDTYFLFSIKPFASPKYNRIDSGTQLIYLYCCLTNLVQIWKCNIQSSHTEKQIIAINR